MARPWLRGGAPDLGFQLENERRERVPYEQKSIPFRRNNLEYLLGNLGLSSPRDHVNPQNFIGFFTKAK
jgi:hypothetical protein